MYHPAAALHQGTLRQTIENDMLRIPQLLAQNETIAEVEPEPEPQQLDLF